MDRSLTRSFYEHVDELGNKETLLRPPARCNLAEMAILRPDQADQEDEVDLDGTFERDRYEERGELWRWEASNLLGDDVAGTFQSEEEYDSYVDSVDWRP